MMGMFSRSLYVGSSTLYLYPRPMISGDQKVGARWPPAQTQLGESPLSSVGDEWFCALARSTGR
jgi:hypothetical protein